MVLFGSRNERSLTSRAGAGTVRRATGSGRGKTRFYVPTGDDSLSDDEPIYHPETGGKNIANIPHPRTYQPRKRARSVTPYIPKKCPIVTTPSPPSSPSSNPPPSSRSTSTSTMPRGQASVASTSSARHATASHLSVDVGDVVMTPAELVKTRRRGQKVDKVRLTLHRNNTHSLIIKQSQGLATAVPTQAKVVVSIDEDSDLEIVAPKPKSRNPKSLPVKKASLSKKRARNDSEDEDDDDYADMPVQEAKKQKKSADQKLSSTKKHAHVDSNDSEDAEDADMPVPEAKKQKKSTSQKLSSSKKRAHVDSNGSEDAEDDAEMPVQKAKKQKVSGGPYVYVKVTAKNAIEGRTAKRSVPTAPAAQQSKLNGKGSWADFEIDALYHLLVVHRNMEFDENLAPLKDAKLFSHMSNLLESQFNIVRSGTACKNTW